MAFLLTQVLIWRRLQEERGGPIVGRRYLDEAAEYVLPRYTHESVWCETAESAVAFPIAWNVRDDAWRSFRNKRDETAFKAL